MNDLARPDRSQLDWRAQMMFLAVAVAIVVSRRPDAVFNAQFWAEDGKFWYADAYHLGPIKPLFVPHTGYLQTVSRLVAALAQLVPFHLAPLLFNSFAILFKILPVALLVSSRFAALLPDYRLRLGLSLFYLALPGCAEVHANLTNAQWHLALLSFMVLVAPAGAHPLWHWFDTAVALLSGLSGPFAILLTPVAGIRWWNSRDSRSLRLLGITLALALVQLACLFLISEGRAQVPLGASPALLVQIVCDKLFLVPLIGNRATGLAMQLGWHDILCWTTFLVSAAILVLALLKSPLELKLFLIFAGSIFGAALLSPPERMSFPWWQALAAPGNGGRYWFIPNLALLVTVLWMLCRPAVRGARTMAGILVAALLVGIILDWRHPGYRDFSFREYARAFEQSPQMRLTQIPLNPPGWSMMLFKH